MNKLFIIFFASYNPIIVYLLMAQAGLGIMSIRLGLVLFTLLLIMFFFVSMVVYNREYKIKLPKIGFNFFLVNICFLFFIIAIVWGVLKNQYLEFIILDTLFFGEFFLGYFLVKFTNFSNKITKKSIKILGIYLTFMLICSLSIYYYLTFLKPETDFGALKVYVDGLVFNRLVDFIIPIFSASIIFYYPFAKNKFLHLIIICFVVLLCLLTFYRTVYLVLFLGIVAFLIQSFSIKKLLYTSTLIIMSIFFLTLFDSELTFSIFKRILSIFGQENTHSMSRSIRIDQLEMFKHSFDYFPIGYGMGGYIGDYVISTGNNIISLFLIFGPISGLAFLFLSMKILIDSYIITKREDNKKIIYILTAKSSIVLSCLLVLTLFPYKYFAIYFILGSVIGMIDEYTLDKKKLNIN